MAGEGLIRAVFGGIQGGAQSAADFAKHEREAAQRSAEADKERASRLEQERQLEAMRLQAAKDREEWSLKFKLENKDAFGAIKKAEEDPSMRALRYEQIKGMQQERQAKEAALDDSNRMRGLMAGYEQSMENYATSTDPVAKAQAARDARVYSGLINIRTPDKKITETDPLTGEAKEKTTSTKYSAPAESAASPALFAKNPAPAPAADAPKMTTPQARAAAEEIISNTNMRDSASRAAARKQLDVLQSQFSMANIEAMRARAGL